MLEAHPQHVVGGVQVGHVHGERQAVADHHHRLQVRRLRLEWLRRDLAAPQKTLLKIAMDKSPAADQQGPSDSQFASVLACSSQTCFKVRAAARFTSKECMHS